MQLVQNKGLLLSLWNAGGVLFTGEQIRWAGDKTLDSTVEIWLAESAVIW